jgi:hypothetical protein
MIETVLDLRGLRCPHPALRAKKALRNIPVGSVLVLECTDPLTVIDVPLSSIRPVKSCRRMSGAPRFMSSGSSSAKHRAAEPVRIHQSVGERR